MSKRLKGLKKVIRQQMETWNVPGAAVAVIEGDEVIFSEGVGVRNMDSPEPITPQTVFAIGSSTKAFVTYGLGLLADEGKLDWDKPVREYIPTFKMFDPFAAQHMTARDLVSHRSGLPRHDLAWYGTKRSRWELFDSLGYFEPNKTFRSTFQYQNLMYMAAGCLIEQISGMSWEAFTRKHIFKPLGMQSSSLSVSDSQKMDDFALPHALRDDKLSVIPFRQIDAIGPAGSINSNIEDMAKWVRLHLGKGEFEGERLISAEQITQMHRPQMVILSMPGSDIINSHPELGPSDYGLGWFVQRFRGRPWVHHGGAIDGFNAYVSMLPADNIGVVVLCNKGGTMFSSILAMYIYDRMLELPEIDWSDQLKPEVDKLYGMQKEGAKQMEEIRHADTTPSHPLKNYTGVYHHPGYGVFTIRLKSGALYGNYNSFNSEMDHFHYDTFTLRLEDLPGGLPVTFQNDIMGNISQISVPMEPNAPAILFRRQQEDAQD